MAAMAMVWISIAVSFRPRNRSSTTPLSKTQRWRCGLYSKRIPSERSAAKIVFHEQRGFGLAVPGSARAVLIGFYGSFVDALEAM